MRLFLVAVVLLVVLACIGYWQFGPAQMGAQGQSLTVYSARKEHLIKPLFDAYERESGVRVKYLTDKAPALLERLLQEGENTEADLLITVDAGNLWQAAERGLLQPLPAALAATVPEHLRDPQNRWLALSLRARTLVYNSDQVEPGRLSSYEALADPAWRGKLCLRTSRKVYNQSLIAMLLDAHGPERTEQLLRGWVGNLATGVFSSDTQALKAVAAGRCAVTVVNTYYLARLQASESNLPLALFWANQRTQGVHVNISGAAVLKSSQHPDRAVALLRWLLSPTAQHQFAALNHEFPVIAGVPASAPVAAWGQYRADQRPIVRAGELQVEAIKLADRAGYR